MSTLLNLDHNANSEAAARPLCVDCLDGPAVRDRGLCVGCSAARNLDRLAREVGRFGGKSAILAEAALSAILETGPGAGRNHFPTARARLIVAALKFATTSTGFEMDARGRLVLAAIETAAEADEGLAIDLKYQLEEEVQFRAVNAAHPWAEPMAVRVVKDPRGGRNGEIEIDD